VPGKGLILERDYSPQERERILAGDTALGISPKDIFELIGARTKDVYLNKIAYWKDVPSRVWEYTIGGYQVIKKWLSYREHKILGRGLTPDEVRTVTAIARRVAAILLLGPQSMRTIKPLLNPPIRGQSRALRTAS
jgi:hypothetical protein